MSYKVLITERIRLTSPNRIYIRRQRKMLRINDLRISISLLRRIETSKEKKMNKERKTESESMKSKWLINQVRKHHIIRVMRIKITSRTPGTTPTRMMCKKDQQIGRLKRRVEDQIGTKTTKRISLMTINSKMRSKTLVITERMNFQEVLVDANNNNKTPIQWVMMILVAPLREQLDKNPRGCRWISTRIRTREGATTVEKTVYLC